MEMGVVLYVIYSIEIAPTQGIKARLQAAADQRHDVGECVRLFEKLSSQEKRRWASFCLFLSLTVPEGVENLVRVLEYCVQYRGILLLM